MVPDPDDDAGVGDLVGGPIDAEPPKKEGRSASFNRSTGVRRVRKRFGKVAISATKSGGLADFWSSWTPRTDRASPGIRANFSSPSASRHMKSPSKT